MSEQKTGYIDSLALQDAPRQKVVGNHVGQDIVAPDEPTPGSGTDKIPTCARRRSEFIGLEHKFAAARDDDGHETNVNLRHRRFAWLVMQPCAGETLQVILIWLVDDCALNTSFEWQGPSG